MMRRRLDVELVRRGLVDTRSRATEAIAAGRVRVRGDLAVLRAGQAILGALAPQLAGLQAATTD